MASTTALLYKRVQSFCSSEPSSSEESSSSSSSSSSESWERLNCDYCTLLLLFTTHKPHLRMDRVMIFWAPVRWSWWWLSKASVRKYYFLCFNQIFWCDAVGVFSDRNAEKNEISGIAVKGFLHCKSFLFSKNQRFSWDAVLVVLKNLHFYFLKTYIYD